SCSVSCMSRRGNELLVYNTDRGRARRTATCISPRASQERFMSTVTPPEREQQSFAETALRLGGKSEEEARRTGAVDRQPGLLIALLHETRTACIALQRMQ